MDAAFARLNELVRTETELLRASCEDEIQKRLVEAEAELERRSKALNEKEASLLQVEQTLAKQLASLEEREASLQTRQASLDQWTTALEEKEQELKQLASAREPATQGVSKAPALFGKAPAPAPGGVKWPSKPACLAREDDDDSEEESYAARYARMNAKKPDAVSTLVEEDRMDKVQDAVNQATMSAGEIREQYKQPRKTSLNVEREDASVLVAQASTTAGALRDQFSQPWKSEHKMEREDPSLLVAQAETNAATLRQQYAQPRKAECNIEKEDPSLLVEQASNKAGQIREQFEQQALPEDTSQSRPSEPPKVQLRSTLFGNQSGQESVTKQPEKKTLEDLLQEDKEKAQR